MKRMQSWQQFNALPDLLELIPEEGIELSRSVVIKLCEIFAKGGILVESVEDLSYLLTLLDVEYNLIRLENNTITKVKYG